MVKQRGGRWQRPRVARGIAAGIVIVFVGIFVVASIWNGSGPADVPPSLPGDPVSNAVFAASGMQITEGANVTAAGFSPFTVRVVAGNITQVKCVLDGVYLGTDQRTPYSFAVAPPAAGAQNLRCTLTGTGKKDADMSVRFTVGAGSATPFGSSVVQPSATVPWATESPASGSAASISPGSGSPASGTSTSGPPASGQTTEFVVTDAVSLQKALSDARPGTTITMKDGTYSGKDVKNPSGQEPGRFVAVASGTPDAPIVLRGSRNAVLDGGGTGGGYALHLKGAGYWKLQGFTIQSASKGIVLDNSNHNVIDGVHVTNIGAEGVHFRAFSSDNLLTNSVVDNTGVNSPNYGEGVYIGSAQSNWGTYTDGRPDNSDRNQVVYNTIIDTAAENIDIKEGSSDGIVRGNFLGGDKISSKNSADSWIDVKGNGYLIDSNHGVTTARPNTTECGDPKGDPGSTKNPFCDGFQVHVVLPGWGQRNTFTGNRLEVNSAGAGIRLRNTAVGLHNVIMCNNVVTGAGAGAYITNDDTPLDCSP